MENKDHKEIHNEVHHDKDNTGMIIAAVIAILLIVGLIAYFMINNNDVKDAIDDTTDTIENAIDNDNDTKTAADVAGSYVSKVGNTNGADEDTNADSDDYIELVLSNDGTARLVMTEESTDVITGTYTISNNKVRIVTNTNATNDTNNETTDDTDMTDNTDNTTNDTNKTYEFKIGDNDTLSYMNGLSDVKLTKVSTGSLTYIK